MQRTIQLRCAISAVVACGLLVPVASATPLENGGFETDDFSGWTLSQRDQTRSFIGGAASPPLPIEGDYFAGLVADVDPWTELSQVIDMGIGDSLEGYAYYNRTWQDNSQSAYVRIYDGSNNLVDTPWSRSSAGSLTWEAWSFTASVGGTFKLVLGIREPAGTNMHNQAYFDGIAYKPFPEPATLGLLALAGLTILRRKNR